ncbi:MAG: S9 family peptidase [Bacteroidales bacterium]|nr:S9 family peptidase [Bacteroidales bacterium]
MKHLQRLTIFLCITGLAFTSVAQEKKQLTFDDILKWNRITEKALSNDGELVAYKLEPWKGDPVLKVKKENGSALLSQPGGTDLQITDDSRYVIARVKPLEDTIRQLKLNDTQEEDLPMDQLLIFNAKSGEKELIDSLKSFKVPGKWSGWLAYQTKSEVQEKPAGEEAESQSLEKSEKAKKESSENGYTLNIKKLPGGAVQFPYVTDYVFAEEEQLLAFVSTGDNQDVEPGVYVYDLSSEETTPVMQGKAEYEQLSLSKDGSLLAFVSDSTSSPGPSQELSGRKKEEIFSLYLWDGEDQAREIVQAGDESMPEAWTVSQHGNIRFSGSNERIFFGTAPIPPQKDTTKLEEEIPVLDVWHWNEPVLQSVQLNNRKENLKRSYMAVYHPDQGKMVQLETEDFTGIKWIDEGDADHVLAWSYLPYGVRRMWEGYPYHQDFYLVDVETGEATMFKKNCRATPDVSPNGEYVFWYRALDTTWNTWHIESGREYTITRPETIQCADELNDRPMPAYPYGTAGWLEDDEALLVYDRYDIWRVDPQNDEHPVNLTRNGRRTHTEYRLIDYRREDEKEKGLDPEMTYHLHSHNVETRADGYYSMNLKKTDEPERIIEGKFRLNRPIKAKDEDRYLFTRETFQRYPDLLIAEDFEDTRRISRANPQQDNFKWGTVELYSWTSADGRKLDGLLVKPEDFDPNKKYPLIVNFYEKSSQGLYRHRIPEAHRSTVDYHYYTSNDYIIFNPDVYYETGYPGEDAFDCVITGVTQLISEGFIDKEHIAAQGHSWGGYQTAYLATRTDLFAAIESGAPVSNMFSAYGGIRGWSGRNRSFQYERTQSRIGESIWDAPLRYLENSPLFWADKIQTPLLIMHNEADGAVPFSQGVEFFIALRRLRKPAWLLNYNEADHWPTKVRDKLDFQTRMSQFFDHYLKEKPMPEWMKEGIPAVDKGFDMGYELVE